MSMMPAADHYADDVLEAALACAARGWRVVPIVSGTKRPALSAWGDAATVDEAVIRRWWSGAGRGQGVGIVTGARSGIWVLDVDVSAGKAGDETLADLEAVHGPLPRTVEVVTGSGGRHLYFLWPGWNPGTGAGRLGPGLDVRAEGGQVVAPPTRHPSGAAYAWEAGGHPDDVAVADAPEWLLELLRPITATPAARRALAVTGDRPGDRFARDTTWHELLTADGATLLGTRTDRRTGTTYELWARPGCLADHGELHTGATLGYGGTDVLKVHTSAWPNLVEGQTYTRFGYLAATRHGGDHQAAARALGGAGDLDELVDTTGAPVAPEGSQQATAPRNPVLAAVLDWNDVWTAQAGEDWLLWPLIARGRAHALYAPSKTGKSLVALEAALALATGRAVFGQPPRDPVPVLYIDKEMTREDLRERATDFGYSSDDDLHLLHYSWLPSLDGIETEKGAQTVLEAAVAVGAQWVVLDTTARLVAGEENDADTFRRLGAMLTTRLKRAGIAYHRLDHAGKDPEKGQRGSSAKNDDVDVVQRLGRTEGGLVLEATHRRVSWVPERVVLDIDDTDGLRFVPQASRDAWPAGTKAAVADLERVGVPPTAGKRVARRMLVEAGVTMSNGVLEAALRWRKIKPDFHSLVDTHSAESDTTGAHQRARRAHHGHVGHTSETSEAGTSEGTTGTLTNALVTDSGTPDGHVRAHPRSARRATGSPPLGGAPGRADPPAEPPDDRPDSERLI